MQIGCHLQLGKTHVDPVKKSHDVANKKKGNNGKNKTKQKKMEVKKRVNNGSSRNGRMKREKKNRKNRTLW